MSAVDKQTITAIATAPGAAGLGIVRISGPEAITIADQVFRAKSGQKLAEAANYTIHYGHIFEVETNNMVDEVIALLMKKPHSFTGEDVVEFDCHGGQIPLQRVLEVVLAAGARMAEPGEFSRRAFLNGKLDLAQAESIIEIINSHTEKGLDIALNHLQGKLSQRIVNIKNEIIELLAHLEASIDFPEDEIEGFAGQEVGERIESIAGKINKLLATSQEGKIYREGIKTAIVGKPNVGKSSLLNLLLEEKRAIVTDVPGTTRDIIEEYINLEGIPLQIIDTAGIRETEDLVEKIGVERTQNFLRKADLILMMLDVSQGLTADDRKVYELIRDKPVIIIINKTDLPREIDHREIDTYFAEHNLLWMSVRKEKGLEELKQAILDEVLKNRIEDGDRVLITRVRHREALSGALKAVERVKNSFNRGLSAEFLSVDLRDCLTQLGKITGETVTEDIINRIFEDFCLGK